MAVSISISITQNSQNITNNTSNVTVRVTAKWTGGSYNAAVNAEGTPQAKGTCTIDGTAYNFASTFNTGKTTTGSQTIFTKTLNITHGSDGTKKLSCFASYNTYVSSGTVSASASKTLTPIYTKSTLSVANGTLGTSQTLTVTRHSTSYTHSITWTCGTASGTICSNSSATSFSFKPPLSLASQNTSGTSVSIKFLIVTHVPSASISIGRNDYTKTFSIPASVKPSCTIAVSDATTFKDTLGSYIQGNSKFKVDVTATTSYDSAITTYEIKANGQTYTGSSSSFTTSVLKDISNSGTITARVKDKRGRWSNLVTYSGDLTTLAYSKPVISISAYRVAADSDTADPAGPRIKITTTYTITQIPNKEVTGAIYRQQNSSDWSMLVASLNGQLTEATGTRVDYATVSIDYPHKITITVTDAVQEAMSGTHYTRISIVVPAGHCFMSWYPEGKGIAFGKKATKADTAEFGFTLESTHGELINSAVPLGEGADLDDLTTEGYYLVETTIISKSIGNKPQLLGSSDSTRASIEVGRMGTGTIKYQRYSICDKTLQLTFQRIHYSNSWGEWMIIHGCSSWKEMSLVSPFDLYDDNELNQPKYRINGNMVTITGHVTVSSSIASGTTKHTIASGIDSRFCPSTTQQFICQGSGINSWLLTVNPGGTISLSRYGTTTYTNVTIEAGVWLPFTVTYSI